MTKVHGHITRKGVKGTITQNGAFNWSYYWLTRYPSALTLTDNGELSITLNWTNNGTGYDGIKVERSVDGINYSVIATLGIVITYDDTAPADGTFYYRIRYYKGSSYSAYSNIDSIAVESWNPALSTPSDLTLTVISDTEIKVDFTINGTGQDGHKIYISTDGVNYTLLDTLTGADNTFSATGLIEWTTYYFYVTAYKGSQESPASNIENAKTHSNSFIITVDTTKAGSANDTFILPCGGGTYTYDYYVDWGEGGAEEHIIVNTSQTHVYAVSGIYQIKIRGLFPYIVFNNSGDRLKLLKIDNWGNIIIRSLSSSYYGCDNMEANYYDVPNTSNVESFTNAFRHCTLFNGDVNFDTSSALTLVAMFYECPVFNKSVISFNTSKCIDMHSMFFKAYEFDQPVSHFDTSKVTVFYGMFTDCRKFNQVINFNCAESDGRFDGFLTGATIFNSDITLSNVTPYKLDNFLNGAAAFNKPLTGIDLSGIKTAPSMFSGCLAFNQSVAGINTSAATNLDFMFYQCYVFNQIINFDCTALTSCSQMFRQCRALNSNITLSNYTCLSTANLFDSCHRLNSTISINTSSVNDMSAMFSQCTDYNQSVAWINTSACTNMNGMFQYCSNFNQSLASFDIANVTNMTNMLIQSNALSTANYDATLIAWAAQTVKASVAFHAGDAKYSAGAAATARGVLTGAPNTWTITDGGQV